MKITSSSLTAGHATDSGSDSISSATTASISPNVNQLILVAVGIKRFAAPPSAPSISGLGLTWVQVATVTGNNLRLTVFRGLGSPTTGVITITPAESCGNVYWTVDQFPNSSPLGTNGSGAVVQSVTNNGSSITSLAGTLGAFSSNFNATYGVLYNNGGTVSLTAGANFSLLSTSLGAHTIGSEFVNNNQTNVSFSWTGAVDASLVAAELATIADSGMISDI